MNLIPFAIGIVSIFVFMFLLHFFGEYLQNIFGTNMIRVSNEYQGGEVIQGKERRYRSDEFRIIIYFTILHAIGFFGASMYVLVKNGLVPLNWTTIGFGAIILYSIIFLNSLEAS